MNIYKLAKRLAWLVIFYHMHTDDFKVKVLPAYEKAALKLAFHLNCADHEPTEEIKKKVLPKSMESSH